MWQQKYSLSLWLGGFFISSLLIAQAPIQTTSSIAERLEALEKQERRLYSEVADGLRCPTCTGISVLQSEAAFSLQIRGTVIDQILKKKSSEEIMQYFKDRYGVWILREPPKEGLHFLVAWLAPVLTAVLGALAVWAIFWRKRVHTPQNLRSSSAILTEFQKKVKEKYEP